MNPDGGDNKKPKRSRKTPVAGTPTEGGEPPARPTPKPRKSRRTPVSVPVTGLSEIPPLTELPVLETAPHTSGGIEARAPAEATSAPIATPDISTQPVETARIESIESVRVEPVEVASLEPVEAAPVERVEPTLIESVEPVRVDPVEPARVEAAPDKVEVVELPQVEVVELPQASASPTTPESSESLLATVRDRDPDKVDVVELPAVEAAVDKPVDDKLVVEAAVDKPVDDPVIPDERLPRAESIRPPLPRDSNLSLDTDAAAVTATPVDEAKPYEPVKLGDGEKVYDDPELAAMPEPETVGDISNIALPPAASGTMPVATAMNLPDPAAAAFEAARIAEQMVGGNIETASGAAIVAAAAAGAAIEAVRMRALHGDGTQVETVPASNTTAAAVAAATKANEATPVPGSDPVTTVRMQRERVLRALAADVAANAQNTVAAEQAAAAAAAAPGAAGAEARARAPSQPGYPRAPTSPGDEPEELDPVQIAALAIQKLRQRASTDFAELRGHYQRHDIVVLVLAFVIIVIAGRVHGSLVTPATKTFSERGLEFQHSTTWFGGEQLSPMPPRIIRDPSGQPPKRGNAYHVAFTNSLDVNAHLEVLIDKKPGWSNIVTGLELERRNRFGELYTLDDSSIRSIVDQDWLRTEYRYAHVVVKGDAPRVDRAIEYATIDREQIYVVTMFGSKQQLDRIEEVIVPTLRVPTRSGLPLVPQTRSLGQRTFPNDVSKAFESTVMVVVADLVDGRLKARGGGSGVIVGRHDKSDGSILTNYHVIHDKDGRLHDVFVIARFSTLDRAPQLQCAGRPSRSKLQRELDLALIKCDTDLDGRTWTPATDQIWPTLPEAATSEIKMGQRVWVLGYPDAGGGGLTLSEGSVEGWTGQDGTQGRDFIKTDASITHGNSGGPVVDDSGKLIGIAAASRTKVTASGTVVEVAQVGLVRPLPMASDLLAIAAAGWTPREGHTDVELQPSAVEAPSEGVRIGTKIIDASNDAPIRDALVLVLRPGVKASSIDVNRLDDQTLAWGRSNTQGDVTLKQPVPVPGTYTVMVTARGYEPLIGDGALKLTDKTPPAYDPWGKIKLSSR